MTNQDEAGTADAGFLNPAMAKSMYSICYYLAFGATYASEMAMEFMPADSMVLHGLRDGAEAAQNAWKRSHGSDQTAESEMDLPDPPAGATEKATAGPQERTPLGSKVDVTAPVHESAPTEEHAKAGARIQETLPRREGESTSEHLKRVMTEVGLEALMAEIVA
jgi:hypothetical protein